MNMKGTKARHLNSYLGKLRELDEIAEMPGQSFEEIQLNQSLGNKRQLADSISIYDGNSIDLLDSKFDFT